MSKKGKKGLIAVLVTVAVLGAGVGTAAILTKGFTQWGAAEKLVKGGVVVDTFTADRLQGSDLRLIGKEDAKLNASIVGSLSDSNVLTLGDKETDPAVGKSDLEELLGTYGLSNSTIESVEKDVVALNVAKLSKFTFNLNVEYKEESAESGAIKMAYFDAVRINYKISAPRGILSADKNESKKEATYNKRTNKSTTLSETIDLFALEKEATQSVNTIDFLAFSIGADKDNTVEIKSVELLRKAKGHDADYCWVTQ